MMPLWFKKQMYVTVAAQQWCMQEQHCGSGKGRTKIN